MNQKLLIVLLVFSLVFPFTAKGEDAVTPSAELRELFTRTAAKVREGKRTPAELAGELAAFDALRAKYREQKSEEVAEILFVQALVYFEVLNDLPRARQLFQQAKLEYPGTKVAATAEEALAAVDEAIETAEYQAKAPQVAAELVGKPAPGLSFVWASRAGLKTLGELKGKVVVLDFWATWCGPCVRSFPQVRELTAHYKGAKVEVIGVTSIQGVIIGLGSGAITTKGDPEKEMALMKDYIKEKEITWTIVFSEGDLFNRTYGIGGIPHLVIIAPDGTVRHNGLRPADPDAKIVEKVDAILKEFEKPVPAVTAKS